MKWIIILLIIAFIAYRMMPAKGVKTITVAELKKRLSDKNSQFIDVRTSAEYKGGHIKEFSNIPLNALNAHLSKLDKSKETFVICQSGMRSAQAAKTLKKAGFERVINVRGGMSAWR
ncbi:MULTISPECIES: rhodanese-like domain-containing protein [Sporosarcina]|uniref:Rhodanese-like domain-containing protein n=1 Tax=Sporosarcina contaminans TaxID=633403 RepID=A0ABW3TW73_9BACL